MSTNNAAHTPWTIRQFQEAQAVCEEVGLTPRQLAEQRAELIEALREIHIVAADAQLRASYMKTAFEVISAKARAAVAKATDSTPADEAREALLRG